MVPSQFIVGDLMQPRQGEPVPVAEPPPETIETAAEALPEAPTPPAEPEIEALNNRLQKIQSARMDPTLSPSDPIFEELDAQENLIKQKITELSGPPGPTILQPTEIPETDIPEIPAAPPIVTQAITPAAPVTPVAPVTPPVVETGRDKKVVQGELNRVRQSLKRTEAAVKNG
jgi:hypothetical protein